MELNEEKRNREGMSTATEGFLSALFSFYVSGYYLDLKRKKYYVIGRKSAGGSCEGVSDDWNRMDDYIQKCINEEDQALMTEVTRIDYIRDRLRKEASYSIEVRDHGNGEERWYRYTTMRGEDEDHAAVSFMDVTDQVLQRQELERLTEELEERNHQLEENQTVLEESASEEEAQLEEITALNGQLEQNRKALESALVQTRESSEVLNRVHEVLGSAPWKIEYDENGKESGIEFSDGLRHLFGYKNEEDYPNSLEFMLSRLHPADVDLVLKDVYGVLSSHDQEKVNISCRYRAYRKDGTMRWYRTQGMVKRRADGSPLLAYGVIIDVTDLEEAAIAQREALEAFESVHDALGSANWEMTFDSDGNMTSCIWSDRFRQMLGYHGTEDFPDELSSWTDLLHPKDKKMTLNAFWRAVQDRTGRTGYSVEYRLLTRTRGYRWYSAHGTLIRRGDGSPKIFYGLFQDINDQVLTAQSQEADIREITELNRRLEKNQEELEASAAEQEAQLEKINALNSELTEQKKNLEQHYDAIRSLSKVYYASYYVDVDQDEYYELAADEDIRSRYASMGSKGKSQAALNWICEHRIAPEYREAARAFMDYSTLSERMRDTEVVSIRVQLVTGNWSRIRFIAGTRHEDRTLKSVTFVVRNINAEVAEEAKRRNELQNALNQAQEATAEQEAQLEEITALNGQLQENQTRLEESAAEQEAQLEEITALNGQLQENQTRLEESAAEQEAQLEETTALNAELQKIKNQVTEAYGMIEGFSQEYHTIWVVNKETSKMRLIRSNGKSTIKRAVQMGIDEPLFDPAFEVYVNSCVEPEDRERMLHDISFAEIMRHLQENPDSLYAVSYLRRDDSGKVGYHQIAFANADTEDGVRQFVYGFRDIDQIVKEEQKQKEELKKAKEEAESASAAKTSFLFNMSHDIRTPMNAIMGFRDLLEKHQDDPERRQDYLNKIQEASTVLLSIINNVLEMARIEKGTLEIDETAWSTEQFNDTLYSVFHEMMKEKGLEFTRQIDVQHHYVYCDPIKLREIFINVLSNAYKYTNAGGKVHMHLEEIPSEREGWVLYRTTISDTGIGMSEDFIPHIFEEFARENNTTDAKVEGTGLGMPIVKRLVEMLDGTIEVQSRKGEGSAFIITLPHRIADRSNLVDHEGVELDPKLFRGRHILLAEDNDLNAEIAMEILGEAGFVVDRAEDGAVCVDMLEAAEPGYYDLILMDIQMPNMNGYEATRAIRALGDQQKASIKILAMTANAFEEDRKNAFKAGMDGHLAKPISISELMKTLAMMLG